jgi:hypothetical protein
MNADSLKLELVKQLLETEDKGIIAHIKAVFETQTTGWWDTLPTEVKQSVERGIAQADAGETIAHDEARNVYAKWLKK